MKRNKEKPREAINSSPTSLGSMADIFSKAGFQQTEATTPQDTIEKEAAPPSSDSSTSPKIDLRRVKVHCERKHRGGKTVTLVEGLSATSEQRESLLKQMKTALGCGGLIEDEALVLQGDIADRVRSWLEKNA